MLEVYLFFLFFNFKYSQDLIGITEGSGFWISIRRRRRWTSQGMVTTSQGSSL